MTSADILFQNDHFVAINKPNGLLVHRSSIAVEAEEFALQHTSKLVGKKLYPVHRIDRPTSGVLLFACHSAAARELHAALAGEETQKQYVALVRGWMTDDVDLDYPVYTEKKKRVEARTQFIATRFFHMDRPVGPYPSARFTEVEAILHSGRWHQIRQHLAHLRHYIINDRVHGCRHNNRLFAEELDIYPLFLHAERILFKAEVLGAPPLIEASRPLHWQQFIDLSQELPRSEVIG